VLFKTDKFIYIDRCNSDAHYLGDHPALRLVGLCWQLLIGCHVQDFRNHLTELLGVQAAAMSTRVP